MFSCLFSGVSARGIPQNNGSVIACLCAALLCIVLLFFFRRRFLKILFACGAEVALFMACELFFGETAVISVIMQWITAAVACIMTVAIVNRIDWSNMRGRPGRDNPTKKL